MLINLPKDISAVDVLQAAKLCGAAVKNGTECQDQLREFHVCAQEPEHAGIHTCQGCGVTWKGPRSLRPF